MGLGIQIALIADHPNDQANNDENTQANPNPRAAKNRSVEG
jgi:hypothetical protein